MAEASDRLWQKLRQKKNVVTQMPLALLSYLKKPAATNALSQHLIALDDELQSAYLALKDMDTHPAAEEAKLRAIRAMEDARFELLSQLHGSNVSQYHRLTST